MFDIESRDAEIVGCRSAFEARPSMLETTMTAGPELPSTDASGPLEGHSVYDFVGHLDAGASGFVQVLKICGIRWPLRCGDT